MSELKIPQNLQKRFEKLSEIYNQSKEDRQQFLSFFEQFLNDAEDYHLALEAYKEAEKRGVKPIPMEEVVKKLGLNKY